MKASVTIGFAGMTHLGIVSATAVAAKGFEVVCYDADQTLCDRLNVGDVPVQEPDLDMLIASNGERQRFVSDIATLSTCDIVYISADVPTDDEARSDLSGINGLIRSVVPYFSAEALLVVLCQVPPGFSRAISGLSPERVYYQVETLVFGQAVERAIRPERFIVGCATPTDPIDPRFAAVLGAYGCPILKMRYESAELAKIAINCCLVASISVANTLAEVSEAIGADWSEIIPALRLDERIGPKSYLTPGLGIAGGNLERDLVAMVTLSEEYQTDGGIIRAFIANSAHRRVWAARKVRALLAGKLSKAKLAVWGLAYKENTNSIKNSPSLATIQELQDFEIAAHDPLVSVASVKHPAIIGVSDPLLALDGAEMLMILTPWPIYRKVEPLAIASRLKGRVVIDPYRVLSQRVAVSAGLDYHTLGIMTAR